MVKTFNIKVKPIIEGFIMKKIIIIATCIVGLFCACNPITDETSLGGVTKESDLKLKVYATSSGGNQIVMVNKTKGVGSYWDYIVGKSSRDSVTASLPFLGQQDIKFTGLCDGGTVSTTRTVNITRIDHPVDSTWALFAGETATGKKWVWDDTVDGCYGDGGWEAEFVPDWDPVPISQTEDPGGYMVFDLNGGPNFTCYDSTGKIIRKGTFSFDMTNKINNTDDGSQWSTGELTLSGATVLNGHLYGDTAPVYRFCILSLTDNKMTLCAAPANAVGWDSGTFWLFKCKNE